MNLIHIFLIAASCLVLTSCCEDGPVCENDCRVTESFHLALIEYKVYSHIPWLAYEPSYFSGRKKPSVNYPTFYIGRVVMDRSGKAHMCFDPSVQNRRSKSHRYTESFIKNIFTNLEEKGQLYDWIAVQTALGYTTREVYIIEENKDSHEELERAIRRCHATARREDGTRLCHPTFQRDADFYEKTKGKYSW